MVYKGETEGRVWVRPIHLPMWQTWTGLGVIVCCPQVHIKVRVDLSCSTHQQVLGQGMHHESLGYDTNLHGKNWVLEDIL